MCREERGGGRKEADGDGERERKKRNIEEGMKEDREKKAGDREESDAERGTKG